jgi:hypothetical protein
MPLDGRSTGNWTCLWPQSHWHGRFVDIKDRANHLTDLFLGVAVSIGLRAALEKHDIPGKIVLLGTPGWSSASRHQFIPRSHATKKAEEVGNGKVALLEKGAYDGIDVCLMYV